jgi:transposase
MDLRELRALEIAARSRINFHLGRWIVPSQSGNGTYSVHLNPPFCTCEDFQVNGGPTAQLCKHILAAALVAERDGGKPAQVINVDAVPKKPQYPQQWEAYNEAQINEKRRLYVLLADLCKNLPERPYLGGRYRRPMSDVVFACAAKVYSTISSRRFGSDLDDAADRGFLTEPMHPNKVNCHMENPDLFPVLKELVARSALPLRVVDRDFAVDSTGFSTSRHIRWHDEKWGRMRSGRDWVKVHIITGVTSNIVTAVEVKERDAADSPQLKPLVEATVASGFKLSEVSGDKAYLSRENLELIAAHNAAPFIPFKSNSVPGEEGTLWERLYGYFMFRREDFLRHYHKRSNVEATFSMIKAKFGDAVRARIEVAMKNEAVLKILLHNLCCVILAQCELGIEALFDHDPPAPAIIPIKRFNAS